MIYYQQTDTQIYSRNLFSLILKYQNISKWQFLSKEYYLVENITNIYNIFYKSNKRYKNLVFIYTVTRLEFKTVACRFFRLGGEGCARTYKFDTLHTIFYIHIDLKLREVYFYCQGNGYTPLGDHQHTEKSKNLIGPELVNWSLSTQIFF